MRRAPHPSRPSSTPDARSAPAPPSIELIQTSKKLASLCHDLAASPLIALDSEFIREKTYYPVLEIVQIADGRGRIALLDIPALGDLGALGGLLERSGLEIVLHSATQDIQILKHYLGFVPSSLFDTQLAAALAGYGAQISHANLVRDVLGRRVPTDQTTSDWSRRPLSPAQIHYASQDVAHLHELRESLLARLSELGRLEWFREEQRRQHEDFLADAPVPDEECYHQVANWARLDGFALALLRELAAWREQEARRRNLPRNYILPDAALTALARSAPETPEALQSLGQFRDIPIGKLNTYWEPIRAAVRRARALEPAQWPSKRAGDDPEIPIGLIELFQALVRDTAEREGIAPALLATTAELRALAIRRHDCEAASLPVLQGWRRSLIGERLLALIDGRMRLRIENRDRLVIEEI